MNAILQRMSQEVMESLIKLEDVQVLEKDKVLDVIKKMEMQKLETMFKV
jgi:hypothetical protein